MPVMDGLELTRAVMNNHPCPILVVSVSVEADSPNVFRLLEAGAVDVFPKPRAILDTDEGKLAAALTSKIRIIAGVHVFRRAVATKPTPPTTLSLPRQNPLRIVAIGASTGGPQALHQILSHLPANFPLPVVCVQHIGNGFLTGLVEWLSEVSRLPLCKATQGELPRAGVVYFAPEDVHLELDEGGRFVLSQGPLLNGHRPSVTVTMGTIARTFGAGAVGTLLTGMGRDGADGLADIAKAGGVTIAQDKTSCVIYGMPKEAVMLGAVEHLLPIEEIAPALIALTNSRSGASEALRQKESP
jgi:two-component system chemotaxis response regulator CheB